MAGLCAPVIMGVLNATPDSFSDGGVHDDVGRAVGWAQRLVHDGAAIVDVGGESTRPGATPVELGEELRRVLPVLDGIDSLGLDCTLSIDTRHAAVAAEALRHGASIVNDVSALSDPQMAAVVAGADAGVVLMHMRGEPQTMQSGEIYYDDVVAQVRTFLAERIERALAAGIARDKIWIDPGIGFGKALAHNLALTRGLDRLTELGCAIVYGPSRKRFLGEVTGRGVEDRERATAAACAIAVEGGADVVRVHDVAAVKDAVAMGWAVRSQSAETA